MSKETASAPTCFILDVDGVLTTGQFFYGAAGKMFKVFGADDNDALALLRPVIDIRFVTGDKRGFEISHRRIVEDMHYSLDLVSTFQRDQWIAERYDLSRVIYMGDGIFDHIVMRKALYSISPSNAHPYAKAAANFVTKSSGGNGAVAEAVLHVLEHFFEPFNPDTVLKESQTIMEGHTV